jgi:hypothetical protein
MLGLEGPEIHQSGYATNACLLMKPIPVPINVFTTGQLIIPASVPVPVPWRVTRRFTMEWHKKLINLSNPTFSPKNSNQLQAPHPRCLELLAEL